MRHLDTPNGYRVRECVTPDALVVAPDLRPAIRQGLERLKIKLPKQSRFSIYLRDDDETFEDLTLDSVAREELLQLHTSITNLENLEEWREKIVEATSSESHTPCDATKSSRSRDSLFELYVAGRLAASGTGVRLGEPDILCNREGFHFSVAAKRLKSMRQLLNRVKEAQQQIDKAKLPGIVAVDLSPTVADYFNARPETPIEQTASIVQQHLGVEFESQLQAMDAKVSKRFALGVIAFVVLSRRDPLGITAMATVHNGHRFHHPLSFEGDIHWQIVDSMHSYTPGSG